MQCGYSCWCREHDTEVNMLPSTQFISQHVICSNSPRPTPEVAEIVASNSRSHDCLQVGDYKSEDSNVADLEPEPANGVDFRNGC